MGKVIPFTQQNIKEAKLIGHRLSFYSYDEIDIALLALNMYGFEQKRYTIEILKTLDPLYIKNCLLKLKNSDIISSLGKKVINMIINNMEEIRDANQVQT